MKRILATLAALTLAACGAAQTGPTDDVKAADVAVHNRVALVDAPPPTTDKVLVIVLENHSLKQIKASAPYTQSLADQYGQATNFKACTHPSKPNYACYTAGSTMGLTSDSSKRVKGQSVFGAAIKAGRTAKTMAESMGSDRCRHGNYGKYVEKHNPQEFFSDENALCEKYNFSYDTYGAKDIAAGKLANVEFIIPNQCSNAHDCSLGTWDKWIKKQMVLIFAGPDWTSGRLTVILTADEDDRKNGNVIPMVVIHPSLSHRVVTTPLNWRHLNRLLTDFGHAAPMREGADAPGMAATFGLLIN